MNMNKKNYNEIPDKEIEFLDYYNSLTTSEKQLMLNSDYTDKVLSKIKSVEQRRLELETIEKVQKKYIEELTQHFNTLLKHVNTVEFNTSITPQVLESMEKLSQASELIYNPHLYKRYVQILIKLISNKQEKNMNYVELNQETLAEISKLTKELELLKNKLEIKEVAYQQQIVEIEKLNIKIPDQLLQQAIINKQDMLILANEFDINNKSQDQTTKLDIIINNSKIIEKLIDNYETIQ